MNPLDIGVIVFVALSAIFAVARGFVREALSIIAWIGAALITLYGYNHVYGLMEPLVHNPLLSEVIAIGGTFIVSLIVLTIITSLIARMVRGSTVSPIDRSLGFVFGIARGVVLVSLAFLLLDMSVPATERPGWIQTARSTPYLAEGADMLRGVLPQSLKLDNADAAGDAQRAADAATEAASAMRAYASPAAAPLPPNEAALPSYPSNDRRDLDRLVGSQHQ